MRNMADGSASDDLADRELRGLLIGKTEEGSKLYLSSGFMRSSLDFRKESLQIGETRRLPSQRH
jgi:hypothetical protein